MWYKTHFKVEFSLSFIYFLFYATSKEILTIWMDSLILKNLSHIMASSGKQGMKYFSAYKTIAI